MLADDIDRERAVLFAVIPNGVPVALEICNALGIPLWPLEVERSDAGVVIAAPKQDLKNALVIVVDDGVETGTVARAAAQTLRAAGVGELVLAVPICPRETMADLSQRYDRIIAAAMPMARRSLAWHFEDFDTIDEVTAYALVDGRA